MAAKSDIIKASDKLSDEIALLRTELSKLMHLFEYYCARSGTGPVDGAILLKQKVLEAEIQGG